LSRDIRATRTTTMAGADAREPAELLADARRGDTAAWSAIIEEIGPLVRGYLRAVGDPDPDAELAHVFDELADDFDTYGAETDDFMMCVFDITVGRQRSTRRALPNAPAATVHARPAAKLDPDIRDAVLLQRLGGLEPGQVAHILGTRTDQVKAWQVQGEAQSADDEWGSH
jgi:hypothetical protein